MTIKIDVDGKPGAAVATKIKWSTANVAIGDQGDVCLIMEVDGFGDGALSTKPRKNMFTVAVNVTDAIQCHTALGRALEALAMRLLVDELDKRGMGVTTKRPADKPDDE